MWVMRRLRFGTKLSLLALLTLAPLLLVLAQLFSRQSADLARTRDEIEGVALLAATRSLVHDLQSPQRPSLRPAREALEQGLSASRLAWNRPEWSGLRARVDGIESLAADTAAPERAVLAATLVEDLDRFGLGLAKASSLLFDPDPATYLLMDLAVSRIPAWHQRLQALQGLSPQPSAVAAADADADAVTTPPLRLRLEDAQAMARDLRYVQTFLADFGEAEPLAEKALQASAAFAASVQDSLAAPQLTDAQRQALVSAGTSAVAAVQAYQAATSSRVAVLLQHRLAVLAQWQWFTGLGSAAVLLLLLYLVTSFQLSVMADLRHVLRLASEIALGNLRQGPAGTGASGAGRDELTQLASTLQGMANSISGMVASVRSNAALVAQAGASLVQGSRSLSDRTEQQAANLEQTAASVAELSSTVQVNASAAQQSDSSATGVRDIAEQGAQAMTLAVTMVEAIQSSTRRMNEVVGVIDGLAFQTNILALNAAVEAARAGESGRGFAVVATEVRSLAQRCAESAREIRQLIGASATQVASGVAQIRTAGESMARIVTGVRGVAANMSQISVSSAEQSTSLSEVSTAVRQLDQITQQNAAMVEQAVAQAEQLQERASTLAQAVALFELQQGSADEALQLVERAMQFSRQGLSQEAFLHGLSRVDAGYHDRDMYVFVLDQHGTYLAFGGNPSKVGSRVQDIGSIDGAGLLQAIIVQADREPGWVEYDISNPLTGQVQTKMSYVERCGDLYLGCGVYKAMAAA
jgi:methyl-accepting chemotaxis protein